MSGVGSYGPEVMSGVGSYGPGVPQRPSVPERVVVNTRAILLSSKNGVPIRDFNRDYRKLLGEQIISIAFGNPAAVQIWIYCFHSEVVKSNLNSLYLNWLYYDS